MNVNTCVILCQFRENTGGLVPTPAPSSFYKSYFFERVGGGIGDYYREVTNAQVDVVGSVFGWLDIGHTRAEHDAGPSGSAQRQRAYDWGMAAARANTVPVNDFSHQVVIVNLASDHGAIDVGGGMLIAHGVNADFNHVFMEHEFGHVLGLEESWSTPPELAYDDDYCIMSAFTRGLTFPLTVLGATSGAGPSPNGAYIRQLGGLVGAQLLEITDVPMPRTVLLSALGHADLAGPQVVMINPGGWRKNTVYVEVRHPSGWDRGIGAQTVLLHETRPGERRTFLRAGPNARGLRVPGENVTSSDGWIVAELVSMDLPGKRGLVHLWTPPYGPNEAWTHEPYFGSRGTFFADVTGSGRADAIVVNDDRIVVRRNNGNGFGPNEAWTQGPCFGSRGTFFADVTGSGRADAIVVNDDRIVVRRSTGNGFGPNEAWTNEPYFGSRGTFFADVTGDRRADAIVVNADRIVVRRSNGNGFGPNEPWTQGPYFGSRATVFADVTGDRRADAIVVNDENIVVRRVQI